MSSTKRRHWQDCAVSNPRTYTCTTGSELFLPRHEPVIHLQFLADVGASEPKACLGAFKTPSELTGFSGKAPIHAYLSTLVLEPGARVSWARNEDAGERCPNGDACTE
jgi:hypothetical protein